MAGYIGSHACHLLLQAGADRVVGVDSMVSGHSGAVQVLNAQSKGRLSFHEIDVRDTPRLVALMESERPDAVLHFAGLTQVAESMAEPPAYWSANVGGTASLLVAMRQAGVPRLVFSSSAAVYGVPESLPVSEAARPAPISPYGQTKLSCESMIRDEVHSASQAGRPFGAALLRYFNVAGAASDGSLGEDHRPETHLIPNALRAALDLRPALEIFGTDYRTMDGTCVRDYVHVQDLTDAHLRMLKVLRDGDCRTCNVGIGRGFSVRQVVDACARVCGKTIPVIDRPRRHGDPPTLVADASRIGRELSWTARHQTLDAMVSSAWTWMRAHPHGYQG